MPDLDEQLRILRRGVEQIVPEDEFRKKLERSVRENRPLAGQVRHRPDRDRRPPRPHGSPAQAPAVPGPGPHGHHHHRQLYGPGRRPLRPRRDPGQADRGPGGGQRARLPRAGRPDHRPGPSRGPPQRRLVLEMVVSRSSGPDAAHDPWPDECPRRLRQANRRRKARLSPRMPLSPHARLGFGRDPGRCRARRNRAALQLAGGARPPAIPGPGAAGRSDDADPGRHRRRPAGWARAWGITSGWPNRPRISSARS